MIFKLFLSLFLNFDEEEKREKEQKREREQRRERESREEKKRKVNLHFDFDFDDWL